MAITQERIRPPQASGNLAHAPTLAPVPANATINRTSGASRATVLPPNHDASAETSGTRYEALRTIGAGGMGEVALVRDNDIGRTVAVKRPIQALDGESLTRFAREVRTIGRLEHPGIVPIHDVGIDENGRHYFVMKYVEGETISSIVAKLRAGDPAYVAKYRPEARMQIFMQLLHTVKYAHKEGVLHRDIKPDNVMIGPYGEVMLMDWGIARHTGAADSNSGGELPVDANATCDGSLIGTPAYMSPEQARGEIGKLDERSDLYSLAVLFYEMLTLRHYLTNKRSSVEMIASIGHDPDRSFGEWMSDLSAGGVAPELIHFLRKGMAKDPSARFQSVDEMLDVLGSIRDGRIRVQCHLTFTKRIIGAMDHAVDHHPALTTFVLSAGALTTLYGLVRGVLMLVHG